MRNALVVVAVVAMALPAFGVSAFFGDTADGAWDNYRSGQLGGYGNNGAGGATRMMKANQHMGWMSFYGATADNTGLTIDQFVQANGGWNAPGLQVILHFRNTDGGLPTVGTLAQPQANGAGGAPVQVGAWIQSVRVGAQAGVGGLVEDTGAGTGTDWSYSTANGIGPAPGFQGANECVAFHGAQVYLNGNFINFGEGISAGPLGTAAGTAWFTPSGSAAHTFGANAAIGWAGGAGVPPVIGYNTAKDTWAVEWLLGGYGNNGGVRAGAKDINGVPQTNDWADSGQIAAKDSNGVPLILTAAYYNPADPRGGLVNANNVAVPLDLAFAMDIAVNPENRGIAFNNNVNVVGATFSNTGFYTKEQGGVVHPYLEVIIPEPATMILLAMGGLALLRRRSA